MINPALILPLHAISGCDTVAAYFGIAKKKTLNEVSYGGQEVVNYWRFNRRQRRCTVYSAVSDFLSRCYGCVPQEDMAVVRSKVWFSGLQHQHTLLQNYKLYLQQRQHCCLISWERITKPPYGCHVRIKTFHKLPPQTSVGIEVSKGRCCQRCTAEAESLTLLLRAAKADTFSVPRHDRQVWWAVLL